MSRQNEFNRFGSSEFAEWNDIAPSGLLTQLRNSVFGCYFGNHPLWLSGPGGIICVAGARSGKGRDFGVYSACAGILQENFLCVDTKKENGIISQDQTADGAHRYCWNAAAREGIPQHRIDMFPTLHVGNPMLVSDVKFTMAQILPFSGNPQGEYFEGRAQSFGEGFMLTLAEVEGKVTPKSLYAVINLAAVGGEEFLGFAQHMANSQFLVCRQVAAEIAEGLATGSAAFSGIMGELLKAFACLSDPMLMESVSPPFDCSAEVLCESGAIRQLYLCPPPEMMGPWSTILRAIITSAFIAKSRRPDAPHQNWMLDECALLAGEKGFPLIPQLYSLGAGVGIRPISIFQSFPQMAALGKDADTIIAASAATQIYFGVRDYETARKLSDMIGSQTLEYDDPLLQARAAHAKQRAVQELLAGGDLTRACTDMAHHSREAHHRSLQQRALMDPAEVLKLPSNKAVIFTDEVSKPILADRKPYYEQRWMAGRFHPSPYHPPLDRVRVKTLFGHRWRPVIHERVPAKWAHLPQYQDGYWSRIGS